MKFQKFWKFYLFMHGFNLCLLACLNSEWITITYESKCFSVFIFLVCCFHFFVCSCSSSSFSSYLFKFLEGGNFSLLTFFLWLSDFIYSILISSFTLFTYSFIHLGSKIGWIFNIILNVEDMFFFIV